MDAVELILRERYALGVEQAPPDWVQMYPLPNEGPFEEEIRRHELEVLDLQEQLSLAHRRLDEQQRFRGLLYEQGEEVLEPIVRDALRALGAHVQEPQQRGREDGRLTDPFGRSAMLEIKGRSGVLRLSDVRQLQDWTSDAVAQEDWSGKGILIANLRCSDPPNERSDVFPDNAKQAAERFQQCLFTTTQLFRALRAHQRGELALQDFWDTIFNTEGVCELPDLEEPAAGTDDTS